MLIVARPFCLAIGLLLAVGPAAAREDAVGVEDIRAFADAWSYIKDHYVEEVDDRRLLEAAIRGMLSELDDYSAWLSHEELNTVEEDATGRYGGLGVRIAVQEHHLQVIAALGDSPAERAGLKPGDRIIAIDQKPLDRSNADEATGWLRGPPGTLIALTVERDGIDEPLELDLTREIIFRQSVTLEIMPDDIVHLRIDSFQQSTATELDAALAEVEARPRPPAGLILDLRDNPGGMLVGAVAVSDRFLSDKLVVYADSRGDEEGLRLSTNAGETLADVPMIVLVNAGSASASEIVAGALQDHGRAIVLGERTFGKGSVQTIWPLRNGGGIRLTTALYRTPSGRLLNGKGIVPDVVQGSLGPADSLIEDERLAHLDRPVVEAMMLFRNARRLFQGSGRLD
jgi:carboxyl-terminal processing protease